ncbi:MAG TPA: COX15/CtaA family protein [Verrucomicrobiae bacterium]|nr:COX15/CtaA family protein [Verrucomicrobiae bacterium]
MSHASSTSRGVHAFAVATAIATLLLIAVGGLVTSKGAGMAVPDWPTSYGYNMFALPIHLWTGGALYEHTHRLWASVVGLMVVALTRWLGGRASRKPLAWIGAAELLAGLLMVTLWPSLRGTGFFLSGIGGVVLLAALVWIRNDAASHGLVRLGWIVFVLVQVQGLLGGLRVVLFKDQLGIFHAALAQVFFVLLCIIALFTSRTWRRHVSHQSSPLEQGAVGMPVRAGSRASRFAILATTVLIFIQLLIGATMRHQHAGLAIWDFPLAHGELWPATDPESVLRYNQQRVEISSANPITPFQIHLHMAHRFMAVVILAAVVYCAGTLWRSRRLGESSHFAARCSAVWLGLILAQVGLGIATVLTHKAADVATAHVVVGVLSLATGALLCIFTFRSLAFSMRAPFLPGDARRFTGRSGVTAGASQR